MRLSSEQIKAILVTFENFISSLNCEVRLFGSRVNDSLRGGDIDLLIISDSAEELEAKRVQILTALKAKPEIGDRKIDLVFAKKEDLNRIPFLIQIYPQSVVLSRA